MTIPEIKPPKQVMPSGAGLVSSVAAESGTELGELEPVRARGYWEQVWRRLRKDKVAVAGGIAVILLVVVAFVGAPVASSLLGHGPNDAFFGASNATLTPLDPWTWVNNEGANAHGKTLFILGSDEADLNRDEFLRLLYGAQVSLEVAVGATIIGIVIGVLMGAIAGYFRGWIDVLVSRLTEIAMAFPYLLFVVALASTVGQRLDDVTLGFLQPGVLALILVLGLFSWYYPARIVRALVLSLREKEFVEAARMTGASDSRIIRSHILPHLVGPVIVYSTLIVAQNVLAEAGLSFLGLGIPLPTASWGNLLETATPYYTLQPWVMIWPGMAVLFTTLAFNLFGDGLRDAFDPRSSR